MLAWLTCPPVPSCMPWLEYANPSIPFCCLEYSLLGLQHTPPRTLHNLHIHPSMCDRFECSCGSLCLHFRLISTAKSSLIISRWLVFMQRPINEVSRVWRTLPIRVLLQLRARWSWIYRRYEWPQICFKFRSKIIILCDIIVKNDKNFKVNL